MIGIFIGSFNPPTKAHLEVCKLLEKEFKKIVLVPVNSKDKYLASFSNRVNMLNILKRKYNFLEVSTIMNNYSYLNYRIIDLLKNEYKNISIIMGSDLLEKLDSFDEYNYLLKNYYFLVITRYSEDVFKIIQRKYAKYIKYKDKFKIINYHSKISSTMVRDYLKSRQDTKDILDQDVLDYIKEKHLY